MISLDLMKMSEVRKAADRSIYQSIDYEIMLYCRLIDKWTMKIVSRVHKHYVSVYTNSVVLTINCLLFTASPKNGQNGLRSKNYRKQTPTKI